MTSNRRPNTGQAPMLRLGVSPLSWVNEVLEDLGKGTTATTCLAEAAKAGYAGVELSRIFPRDAALLSGLLARHNLQLISGWHSGFLTDRSVAEELEAVRTHAALLRDCGASVMVYGECGCMAEAALDIPLDKRLRLAPEQIARYGASLTQFADALANEYGLALAYHHHLMMVAETLDEITAIMNASGPSVGLLLDTGHAAAAGFDYVRLIERFGDRINHIHLKDVRQTVLAKTHACGWSFNQAVRAGLFTVPGDGEVDFNPLSRFIANHGYCGWLVVEAEQDPALAPPRQTVERASHFVKEKIMKPAMALSGEDDT